MRKIALDISPATETHCGDSSGACALWRKDMFSSVSERVDGCLQFDEGLVFDESAGMTKRLPACRAAEVKP